MKSTTAMLYFVLAVSIPCVSVMDDSKIKERAERIKSGGGSVISSSPEDINKEVSEWLLEYLEFLNDVQQKEENKDIQDDTKIIKSLLLYNWMNYLTPELTAQVKSILPEEVKNEKDAKCAAGKLKEMITGLREEKSVKALIVYFYKATDGQSIYIGVSKLMTKFMINIYQQPESVQNDSEQKKYTSDPLYFVHHFTLLMCMQSFHIIFYSDKEKWTSKSVDVDGNPMTIFMPVTSLLTTYTWQMFCGSKEKDVFAKNVKDISDKIFANGFLTSGKALKPPGRKQMMSDAIVMYMEYFHKVQADETEEEKKHVLEVINDLMLLNWIHYLKPDVSSRVKGILSKIMEQETNAQGIEEKLKQKIRAYGEEAVTKELIIYQNVKKGEKSIHVKIKEKITAEFKKHSNDPTAIRWVHAFDLIMCLQSMHLVFYSDFHGKTWASKFVEINGKKMNIEFSSGALLLNDITWEKFAEIDEDEDTAFMERIDILSNQIKWHGILTTIEIE